jgi:DNA-binding response OmpR family regulator
MTKPSVLIIGKDGSLRQRLESGLRTAGCRVVTAPDSREAIQRVAEAAPDIVMLGQDLPDADSLEVCRQIRQQLHPRRAPVFLLTPEGEVDEVLGGREAGVDVDGRGWNFVEYGFGALLAWIDAAGGVHDRVTYGRLELDRRRFTVTVDGRDIKLTATEFRLLWALASEPGKVFDRSQLARACSTGGRSRVRTVDVHIKAIRDKLAECASVVETVHGVGYRFREPKMAAQLTGSAANRATVE